MLFKRSLTQQNRSAKQPVCIYRSYRRKICKAALDGRMRGNMNTSKIEDKNYDVIVVGGGLSGVCAAIASARHGAKTALLQNRPVLGGNASSEIRMHICGADHHGTRPDARETGIIMELLLENRFRNPNHSFSVFDTVLWEKCTFQENLDLYLNTQMQEVEMNGNTIQSVSAFQMTTEKTFCFHGRLFIDTTGDGYLAFRSGAEFMTGREGKEVFGETYAPDKSDCCTMGNSLMFRATDCGHATPFTRPDWAYQYTEADMAFREISEVSSGYWWIELGGDELDTITDGEILRDELLKTLYGVWDYVKNSGNFDADNYSLDWVGFLPGKRESRRIVGDYILLEQDLANNTSFPDAVAYGGWPMDVHVVGGMRNVSHDPTVYIHLKEMYSIPYRCLYSKNIDNLFLGGRAISVSHMAFASTRVMGTCAVIGQAVGTAAAMGIQKHLSPRELNSHIEELQQSLLRDDCYIPGLADCDANNLALQASVSCSSSIPEGGCTNVTNGFSRKIKESSNCWISKSLGNEGQWIALALPEKKGVTEIRLTFDPNLSRQIMPSLSEYQQSVQIPGIPPELVKSYTLELLNGTDIVYTQQITNNYQRLRIHHIAKPVLCDTVKVTVHSTYGDTHARIFEIRVYE